MRWHEIFEDRIDELFDSNVPVLWSAKQNAIHGKFSIKDGENIYGYDMSFHPHNGQWTAGFILSTINGREYSGNRYGNTDTGNQFLVFSTVIKCFEEFIQKYSPDVINFSGNNKNGKADLYRKMIRSLENKIKKYGYKIQEHQDGSYLKFLFIKESQYVKEQTIVLPDEEGYSFVCTKNPSRAEFNKTVIQNPDADIKGLLDGNDLYMWPAWHAHHHQMANMLGLDIAAGTECIFLRDDGVLSNSRNLDKLRNNPRLQRYYGQDFSVEPA